MFAWMEFVCVCIHHCSSPGWPCREPGPGNLCLSVRQHSWIRHCQGGSETHRHTHTRLSFDKQTDLTIFRDPYYAQSSLSIFSDNNMHHEPVSHSKQRDLYSLLIINQAMLLHWRSIAWVEYRTFKNTLWHHQNLISKGWLMCLKIGTCCIWSSRGTDFISWREICPILWLHVKTDRNVVRVFLIKLAEKWLLTNPTVRLITFRGHPCWKRTTGRSSYAHTWASHLRVYYYTPSSRSFISNHVSPSACAWVKDGDSLAIEYFRECLF